MCALPKPVIVETTPPNLYRLAWAWRSSPDVVTRGEPFPREVIDAWVALENRRYPDILHWTEPA